MYLRPPWSIALLYHAFAVHNSRWIRKLLVEIYICLLAGWFSSEFKTLPFSFFLNSGVCRFIHEPVSCVYHTLGRWQVKWSSWGFHCTIYAIQASCIKSFPYYSFGLFSQTRRRIFFSVVAKFSQAIFFYDRTYWSHQIIYLVESALKSTQSAEKQIIFLFWKYVLD